MMGFGVQWGWLTALVSPHQALDGEFNEENRERCRAATAPLIEAVDNLTAFASNPEFATVPAQISPEVGCCWDREDGTCDGLCSGVERNCAFPEPGGPALRGCDGEVAASLGLQGAAPG